MSDANFEVYQWTNKELKIVLPGQRYSMGKIGNAGDTFVRLSLAVGRVLFDKRRVP